MQSFVDLSCSAPMRETDRRRRLLPAARSQSAAGRAPWWRDAVVYQVYVRSFADANGDGIGDLAGVRRAFPTSPRSASTRSGSTPGTRRRLPIRLRHLGLPRDRSRARDARGGRAADRGGAGARHPHDRRHRPQPRLERAPVVRGGARAPAGITGARALLVPARHAARAASCRRTGGSRSSAAPPGRARRRRVVPAPVRARAARPELGAPGRVGRARGHPSLLVRPRRRGRADRLGRAARQGARRSPRSVPTPAPGEHPYIDRDELHEIYRRWRAIADSYQEPRVLIGEIWLPDAERFARYLRPDELHTAFNFDFLACPWEPGPMRASIDSALAAHAPVDAPATWVLSNHDVTRPVTRYGRADTSLRVRGQARGDADRPRARHEARARGRAARDGAARLDVRLPGRRARTAGSRGHPLRAPPGSDVAALGRRRSRPRRLPRPAPLVGLRAALRLQPERRGASLARPARRLGAAHRRGAEHDPASMLSLYRAGLRIRREAPWGDDPCCAGSPPATTCSRSRAASGSSASSISARNRLNFRPGPKS